MLILLQNKDKKLEQKGNEEREPWTGRKEGHTCKPGRGQVIGTNCVFMEALKVPGSPRAPRSTYEKYCSL